MALRARLGPLCPPVRASRRLRERPVPGADAVGEWPLQHCGRPHHLGSGGGAVRGKETTSRSPARTAHYGSRVPLAYFARTDRVGGTGNSAPDHGHGESRTRYFIGPSSTPRGRLLPSGSTAARRSRTARGPRVRATSPRRLPRAPRGTFATYMQSRWPTSARRCTRSQPINGGRRPVWG